MDKLLTPTDCDLEQLRQQVKSIRKQQEYRQLSAEVKRSTQEAFQEHMAMDGEMVTPDSYKVLRTKRHTFSFIDMVLRRLVGMVSFRPIVGNIIAIGLAMLALYYVYQEVDLAGFAKYRDYFGIGIQLFGAIQIIKSGTRSLLLPLIAMIWGGMVAHTLGAHDTLFTFGKTFYEHLMITGIVGVGVSVLTID